MISNISARDVGRAVHAGNSHIKNTALRTQSRAQISFSITAVTTIKKMKFAMFWDLGEAMGCIRQVPYLK